MRVECIGSGEAQDLDHSYHVFERWRPHCYGAGRQPVASGRNATGFSDILGDLSGKLVEVASELSEPRTTVNYLWQTSWPDGQNRYKATEQAAQAAGMKLQSKGIARHRRIGQCTDSAKAERSRLSLSSLARSATGNANESSHRR